MNLKNINKVSVIGGGAMGHGIAEAIALGGYEVALYDIKNEILEEAYGNIGESLEKLEKKEKITKAEKKKTLNRIYTTTNLEEAAIEVDFSIEAVPEEMELKKDVFSDLDRLAPEHTILASNTSSLSITEIAKSTERPEKILGMHWFNPPVLMDLIEVVYGEKTSDNTAKTTYKLAEKIGKTPIYCRKDIRRFVVNNVLEPFLREPMWMLSKNETEIQEADAAMVCQCNYPMGPFELSDMVGIDVGYRVKKEANESIPPVMKEKVENNELGKKTGKGFYNYADGPGANYKKGQGKDFDTLRIEAMMINEAAKLIQKGVAKAKEIDTGMKLGTGFPKGPCQRGDEIGLDKVLEKLEKLYDKYEEKRYKPPNWLKRKVENGETGKEASCGFYDYEN